MISQGPSVCVFNKRDPQEVLASWLFAQYMLTDEVQIAYAIGVAKPVSVMVETFGTARISEEVIVKRLCELVDLRPAAIIARFDLRRPIYSQFAAYGHMGREDIDLPWEKTDRIEHHGPARSVLFYYVSRIYSRRSARCATMSLS